MLVDSTKAFENLKISLSTYTPNSKFGILCIVNSEDLYTKCREILVESGLVTEQEILVIYKDKKQLSYSDSKKYFNNSKILNKVKWVFLWNNKTITSANYIDELVRLSTYFTRAGFITKNTGGNYYRVEDLYDSSVKTKLTPNFEKIYCHIDATDTSNILTPYRLFNEYLGDINNTYEYGLALRRLGFYNILDTNT